MRALVMTEAKQPPVLQERENPKPGPGEVVVELKAAALNRRDFWILQGMYPGIELPVVLGSDGAGTVTDVGDASGESWQGREVIMNPGLKWGSHEECQADEFQILGMPVDGTFATHIVVPVESLFEKPQHLGWHEAAALPLAGVTAYRAMFTQGQLQPSDQIMINGVGGGVASLAMQFAIAAGAKTFATSSSPDKRERAKSLGATDAFDYSEPKWHKQVVKDHGPMDLIIDSGGGDGYNQLLDLAAVGGRVVSYGATAGPPAKFDLFKLFWKQLKLVGSTMGSPADFRNMVEFVEKHQIIPIVDQVVPLESGSEAIQNMRTSQQFGKVVIAVA